MECEQVNPTDCGLMLVEPLFNLSSIQKSTDELVFEDFGFQSLCVGNSPAFTHAYQAYKFPTSLLARGKTSLVVDSGFSFTHAAPVYQNKLVTTSAKRINLGGKALTNYLKELVSYRAWNVMDETYIMEDVKEKLCFVSTGIDHDLNMARSVSSSHTRNMSWCFYVLRFTSSSLSTHGDQCVMICKAININMRVILLIQWDFSVGVGPLDFSLGAFAFKINNFFPLVVNAWR